VIDRTGRDLVPLQYLGAAPLGEGCAAVWNAEGTAVFDSQGKQLTPFKFAFGLEDGSFDGFNGGLMPVRTKDDPALGYINASGAWVIPPQFQNAFRFSGELARVKLKTGYFGYVNRRGKIVWTGGSLDPCPPF
jgi:hypothetical protein